MEFKLLSALDPDVEREVLSATTRRRYAKGMVLFHEGDPGDSLHLIAKGRVAIRVGTPGGDTATLTILGPGTAFGEQALVDPKSLRTATAVALEPVETMVLPGSDFEALRRSHPTVDRLLIEQLVAQVRRLSTHLTEALYVAADKRVCRRMLDLHDVFEGGEVRVTQDDVATMAGTTRPTVNRVMQALVEAKVIDLAAGKVPGARSGGVGEASALMGSLGVTGACAATRAGRRLDNGGVPRREHTIPS